MFFPIFYTLAYQIIPSYSPRFFFEIFRHIYAETSAAFSAPAGSWTGTYLTFLEFRDLFFETPPLSLSENEDLRSRSQKNFKAPFI